MTLDSDSAATPKRTSRIVPIARCLRPVVLTTLLVGLIAAQPAIAQSAGLAFCETDMALTIKNIFTLIQFGGPLIGGVIALGAIVATPMVRNYESKKELKGVRDQGLLWGVIAAPLGTAIIQFLLNNVVAGGTSCGF